MGDQKNETSVVESVSSPWGPGRGLVRDSVIVQIQNCRTSMFDQPVRSVMQRRKVLKVPPETLVSKAAKLMARRNVGANVCYPETASTTAVGRELRFPHAAVSCPWSCQPLTRTSANGRRSEFTLPARTSRSASSSKAAPHRQPRVTAGPSGLRLPSKHLTRSQRYISNWSNIAFQAFCQSPPRISCPGHQTGG